jgi:hypothetical protein
MFARRYWFVDFCGTQLIQITDTCAEITRTALPDFGLWRWGWFFCAPPHSHRRCCTQNLPINAYQVQLATVEYSVDLGSGLH